MAQRIVHVDDHRDYCGLVERAFRAQAPEVSLTPFYYGEDAVSHLTRCAAGSILPPDLLLVDRVMPDLDGFEVIQAVRELPTLAGLPIFMLSETHEDEHIIHATELGADGYIHKPMGDHRGLVRDILSRSPWRRQSREIVRVSVAPETVPVRRVDIAERVMAPGVAEHHMNDFFAACRYASINPRLALNMSVTDSVLDAKRRLVVRWLLTFPAPLPWGTVEVQEFLPFATRYIEKCRAENRRSPLPVCGFGSLALTN